MTPAAFAERLDIGKTTLFRYEKDQRQPDAEFLIKLNVLYGIQPLWLLTGRGPEAAGERLTPREARLLAAFRATDDAGRAALEAMAAALPVNKKTKKE